MAGFEVIIYGRFWVITVGRQYLFGERCVKYRCYEGKLSEFPRLAIRAF